jgi:hypothetical protein
VLLPSSFNVPSNLVLGNYNIPLGVYLELLGTPVISFGEHYE